MKITHRIVMSRLLQHNLWKPQTIDLILSQKLSQEVVICVNAIVI